MGCVDERYCSSYTECTVNLKTNCGEEYMKNKSFDIIEALYEDKMRSMECEAILDMVWATIIGPYYEQWESQLPKPIQNDIQEVRNRMREFYKFDDSE